MSSWKSKAAQKATHAQARDSLKWSNVDVLGGSGQSMRAGLLPGSKVLWKECLGRQRKWACYELSTSVVLICIFFPAATWELSRLLPKWMPAAHLGIHQGWSRICACMGVFLRTGYDCHSRGSPLIGTTPGLWLSKASTNKEWNMLGREAGILMGSGGQVKEPKFFPIPFSPGGHWPRDCGIQKGGGSED